MIISFPYEDEDQHHSLLLTTNLFSKRRNRYRPLFMYSLARHSPNNFTITQPYVIQGRRLPKCLDPDHEFFKSQSHNTFYPENPLLDSSAGACTDGHGTGSGLEGHRRRSGWHVTALSSDQHDQPARGCHRGR